MPTDQNELREAALDLVDMCEVLQQEGRFPRQSVTLKRARGVLAALSREDEGRPPMNFEAAQDVAEQMDYSPIAPREVEG